MGGSGEGEGCHEDFPTLLYTCVCLDGSVVSRIFFVKTPLHEAPSLIPEYGITTGKGLRSLARRCTCTRLSTACPAELKEVPAQTLDFFSHFSSVHCGRATWACHVSLLYAWYHHTLKPVKAQLSKGSNHPPSAASRQCSESRGNQGM